MKHCHSHRSMGTSMNSKNVFAITALVVAATFAIQLLQPNQPLQSTAQAQVAAKAAAKVAAIEFARLDYQDEDNVTWLIGGNVRVRTESVKATYRRLGGKGQGSFSDLLNQIGSDGWNLLQKDGNVWIFSRRAS